MARSSTGVRKVNVSGVEGGESEEGREGEQVWKIGRECGWVGGECEGERK